jgi:hypothetical protein
MPRRSRPTSRSRDAREVSQLIDQAQDVADALGDLFTEVRQRDLSGASLAWGTGRPDLQGLGIRQRIRSAWCTELNVSVLPAEPTTVVGFFDAQAELKSPATVRRYIATIAYMHRAAGLGLDLSTLCYKLTFVWA